MYHNNDIGILAFVPDLWEGYWRPKHHIINRLARDYKVLWVSPPLSWRKAFYAKSLRMTSRGVNKISPSFWTYSPECYLPGLPGRYGLKSLLGFVDRILTILLILRNIKSNFLSSFQPVGLIKLPL